MSIRTREQRHKTKRNIGSRFGFLRNVAKRRGLAFDLTKDEYSFLVSSACFYCGKKTLGIEMGGGLDRIDRTKGYIGYNVLPCCGFCNMARGVYRTVEEFKFLVAAIIRFRKGKSYAK